MIWTREWIIIHHDIDANVLKTYLEFGYFHILTLSIVNRISLLKNAFTSGFLCACNYGRSYCVTISIVSVQCTDLLGK